MTVGEAEMEIMMYYEYRFAGYSSLASHRRRIIVTCDWLNVRVDCPVLKRMEFFSKRIAVRIYEFWLFNFKRNYDWFSSYVHVILCVVQNQRTATAINEIISRSLRHYLWLYWARLKLSNEVESSNRFPFVRRHEGQILHGVHFTLHFMDAVLVFILCWDQLVRQNHAEKPVKVVAHLQRWHWGDLNALV